VGRPRIDLKYVALGHIFWKSGFPSVGAMCRAVTIPAYKGVAVPAPQCQGGGPARVLRAGQDGLPASSSVWGLGAGPVTADRGRPES